MTTESHVFEIEIRVSGNQQEPVSIFREYQSKDSASTDKAARELLEGFKAETLVKFKGVADGE